MEFGSGSALDNGLGSTKGEGVEVDDSVADRAEGIVAIAESTKDGRDGAVGCDLGGERMDCCGCGNCDA